MTAPLRILFVEDSPDDAQLAMLQLEQDEVGAEYQQVDNESDYRAALSSTPDLILSDYSMPQFNGLRALRILKESGLDIPFILISGTVGEEIAVSAIKEGADDYLMKDRPARLGAAIQHALEQKRLREEKKRADAALRHSQEAYAELVNTVNGIVWEADANTFEFSFVSQQAEHFLGYPVERWINEPTFWKDHIHPDDQTWAVDYCITCTREKKAHEFEYRMIAADEQIVWLRDIVTVIVENDQPVTLRGIMVDITAQKQAKETLRLSEERFKNLLETAPDAIVISDAHGRIVQVNAQVEKLFDYQREELVGQMVEILTPDRFRTQHPQHRAEFMANPSARYMAHTGKDINGRRKDGSEFPVEISLNSLETPNGILVTEVIRDITERRWAEEALLASRSQFRSVLETIPDCVLQVGSNGTIQFVNRANPIITSEEVIGTSILDHIHLDYQPSYQAMMARVLATGEPDELEILHKDENGTQTWYLNRIGPMYEDKRVAALIIVMQDITERKNAESQIKRQVEYLKALHMVDMTISASTDMHMSLRTILNQVISKLQVDAADILLIDPITHTFDFKDGIGFNTREVAQKSIRLTHKGILSRETVHIPNLKSQQIDSQREHLITKENFICYFGVPLLVKGEHIGILEVFHRQPLKPDHEWINFLEALAGQAALAIDNGTLFQNLQHSNTDLMLAYDATIEGWSRAMDLRDKETEGHTLRVTDMTMKLCRAMNISGAEQTQIYRGALLHDIGKLGVPDAILQKPGKLTDDEWEIMRKHPEFAYDMLVSTAYLKPALDIPYCHHEKWDGTGYPRKLKGEEIPLAARIFAVADVWDAITSDRPYRKSMKREEALEYITIQSGKHFDPKVVEFFLRLLEDLDRMPGK